VLVRAIETNWGAEFMRQHRPVEHARHLTSGPGKLCAALRIDRSLDGADLCDASAPVFIGANPDFVKARRRLGPLVTTTRIGLNQAADLPLRFLLANSAYLSKKPARARKNSVSAESL
jgi:DNA-3-methyladenine glycosylase